MNVPHDLVAERAVVGAVLVDWSLLDRVEVELAPEDFYSSSHQTIWSAMRHMHTYGAPIDTVTLRDELVAQGKLSAVGGDEYLLKLTDALPVVAHVEAHARIVRERSIARAIAIAAQHVVARATEDAGEIAELIEYADSTMFRATERREAKPMKPIGPLARELYDELQRASETPNEGVTGAPSGITGLDTLTTGFQGGDMIVVAGRPGMGKSALAGNIAVASARATSKPVAIFSLEMPERLYVRRMAGSEGRIDQQRIRQNRLTKDDWQALATAVSAIDALPIWIDDTAALTVMQLRSKARRLLATKSLGLVVVDYLQLMTAGVRTQSREEEVSIISRSLKALAKEFDVPVVALAQLNREVEKRTNKRPNLGDLRESGAIEQDADVVLMLYRDELYDKRSKDRGIAEISVVKQRSGPTGTVRCRFFDEYTRFENLACEDDPQAQMELDDDGWADAAQ